MEQVKEVVDATGDWDTAFSGSFFSNRKMLDELVVILFISILLMYFILAAQFESFVQPACSIVGDTDRRSICPGTVVDMRTYAESDVCHRSDRYVWYYHQ